MKSKTKPPRATYRLQLGKELKFDDVKSLLPYLHRLGISHVYLSPIVAATSDSTHGYDAIDPTRLNPALGSLQELNELADSARAHGISILLDIVPNHMSRSHENHYWMDVLEHGKASRYANFFDIRWTKSDLSHTEKVVLPILGRPFGEALENQEIKLYFKSNSFFLTYYQFVFPVEPSAIGFILTAFNSMNEGGFDHDVRQEAAQLGGEFLSLPPPHTENASLRRAKAASLSERLKHFYETDNGKEYILSCVKRFNGERGISKSFDALEALIDMQVFELSYWRLTSEVLNYRRFFDINELVGMRVQESEVFLKLHELIFFLIEKGIIQGLRVDHIDGLYDPKRYLQQLQHQILERTGQSLPIVVEKILSPNEQLPSDWPVIGSTGYDFITHVNAVFVDGEGLTLLRNSYEHFVGQREFADTVDSAKQYVIEVLFKAEFENLVTDLQVLAKKHRFGRDLAREHLREALALITVSLDRYRTYIAPNEMSDTDHQSLLSAIARAKERSSQEAEKVLEFLSAIFLTAAKNQEQRLSAQWTDWMMRWQQFCGPVMAKGFEDTSLYSYFCLTSLNEVGGSPALENFGPEQFHSFIERRVRAHPHSMNTTSTHDTKRSQDVRARINVLSEIPEIWTKKVSEWSSLNTEFKARSLQEIVPDAALEWYIYETIIGVWPFSSEDKTQLEQRLVLYFEKAIRERKQHTNWYTPNLTYEKSVLNFIEKILANEAFTKNVNAFVELIGYAGALNALSEIALKTLSPGFPDFYQGDDVWNFSLVDPDNRRKPNFLFSQQLMSKTTFKDDATTHYTNLLKSWKNSTVKLAVTQSLLKIRKNKTDLFEHGHYSRINSQSGPQRHILAFTRHLKTETCVVCIAIDPIARLGVEHVTPGCNAFRDCGALDLSRFKVRAWRDELTGATLQGGNFIEPEDAESPLPFLVLSAET